MASGRYVAVTRAGGAKVPNLYQRGPSYYVRTSLDGKLRWIKLRATELKDAVRERDTYFAAPATERVTTTVRLREHWDAVVEYQTSSNVPKDKRWGERTLTLYRGRWEKCIAPVLGEMRVSDITARDVDRVFDRMRATTYMRGGTERSYSEASIRGVYVILSMLFREAQKARFGPLIASSPVKGATLPEAPKIGPVTIEEILSPEEIEQVCEASTERFAMFFRLAASTGMRLSELCGLLWENVDLQAGTITVMHQLKMGATGDATTLELLVPLKGRKDVANSQAREIPLTPETVARLREYRQWTLAKGQHRQDGFVFSTLKHKPLSQRNVTRALTLAVEKVGIERAVGMHSFRHAYASRLFKAGIRMERISILLGHSSPLVTAKRYVRLFDGPAEDKEIAALQAAGL